MDYELNALFGLSETEPLEKTPVEVPDLPFDDYFYNVKKASASTAAYSVNIQRDALSDELVGDCPEPMFIPGVEPFTFQKAVTVTPATATPDIDPAVLAILRKNYRTGSQLEKYIKKAGGNVTSGMQEIYDLFFDTFLPEERGMVEKAIAAVDVQVFLNFLKPAFYRAMGAE